MAPRGKKVKEGVAKQMKKWERNVGLKIMLTMGYIIGCGLGKALIGIKLWVRVLKIDVNKNVLVREIRFDYKESKVRKFHT